MSQSIVFPLYPSVTILVAYYQGLESEKLNEIKSQVLAKNPEYDFCFLSPACIVSQDQLRSSLYKAVQNMVRGTMRANTVNTEALFGLSPVNNLNEAFKRFGIDTSRSDLVVVKILTKEKNTEATQQEDNEEMIKQVDEKLQQLLGSLPVEMTDEKLFAGADLARFRKLFKLADSPENTPETYSQAAIAGALLHGM